MDSLLEHWSQVAFLMRSAQLLLPAPSDGLGRGELEAFEEYLAHDELELAWDELASVADERKADAPCWAILAQAAHLMGLYDRESEAVAKAAQ